MERVTRFDRRVDTAIERVRGRRVIDRTMVIASDLGDFSLIWHIIGVSRGLTGGPRVDQAFVFAALIGLESLVVNQGIKRLFRRTRPTEAGDVRFAVRRPSTSAFPSGHASAAFFAATLLTAWDGATLAPLWFTVAAIVATSRAYVRIHHPSDVVGGAIVGVGLAVLARLVLVAWTPWA